MPNGFDNPYMEEYFGTWNMPDDFSSDPGYLTGLNVFQNLGLEEAGYGTYDDWLSQSGSLMQEFMDTQASQYGQSPYYQYEGISPDIMNAMTGIFGDVGSPTFSGVDAWGQEGNQAMWAFLWDEMDDAGFYVPESSETFQAMVQGGGEWGIGPLGGVNIFDPESIANALSEAGVLGAEPIRAGEIQALTPEMIEKTTQAYYNPYEATQRDELISKKEEELGGAETGGFASSGARQSGVSMADQLYRGGYEDLLGEIMKMRGTATGDVMNTIYGWQELLSEQTG